MSELEDAIRMAYAINPLREPILRSAIQALQLLAGSHGLDAGCGIGLQALWLAEAAGAAGHVTGMDLSSDLLVFASDLVEKAGYSGRFSFAAGDVRSLPFDDHVFDWAWSADLVGYAPIEPLPLVKELARVVKPGGSLAILAWSSERLLPGYPVLEARLAATSSGIAPFYKEKKPESHFLRALGWLHEAGLENATARTFAGSFHAPLSNEIRSAFAALLQMRWWELESELTQEDWSEYQRLCLPESPDYILALPDYCAFFTYTMFQAKVAA